MKNNISHMLEKAGITGVATAGIGCLFLGCGQLKWMVPGTNTAIPVEILTFTTGLANSFIADGIHLFLNKGTPLGKKTSDRISVVSNAVISGITFFGLLHLAGPGVATDYSAIKAFATGAAGEIAGSAGYEYLTNNLHF